MLRTIQTGAKARGQTAVSLITIWVCWLLRIRHQISDSGLGTLVIMILVASALPLSGSFLVLWELRKNGNHGELIKLLSWEAKQEKAWLTVATTDQLQSHSASAQHQR